MAWKQDPEYYRKWREANKEKVAARAKAYYEANKEKKKAYARDYYAAHKPEYRAREKRNPKTPECKRAARRRAHGVVNPPGELHHGVCAIEGCGFEGRLDLDHDHATGLIRGWICPACNRGLGHFDDSVPRIIGAAKYLQDFYGRQQPLQCESPSVP